MQEDEAAAQAYYFYYQFVPHYHNVAHIPLSL